MNPINKPHHPLWLSPTNSSQSDTLHNHFCKEQNNDSFYSGFVLKSIITIACTYLDMSGRWGGHWVVNPVSAFCLHFVCIQVLCQHLSASIPGLSYWYYYRARDFQSVALPTELSGLFLQVSMNVSAGVYYEFLKQGWCRRGDSNSHSITETSPWN